MTKKKHDADSNKLNADENPTKLSQNNPTDSLQEPKQTETTQKDGEIKKKPFVWVAYLKGKSSQPIIANIVSIFALLVSAIQYL